MLHHRGALGGLSVGSCVPWLSAGGNAALGGTGPAQPLWVTAALCLPGSPSLIPSSTGIWPRGTVPSAPLTLRFKGRLLQPLAFACPFRGAAELFPVPLTFFLEELKPSFSISSRGTPESGPSGPRKHPALGSLLLALPLLFSQPSFQGPWAESCPLWGRLSSYSPSS